MSSSIAYSSSNETLEGADENSELLGGPSLSNSGDGGAVDGYESRMESSNSSEKEMFGSTIGEVREDVS